MSYSANEIATLILKAARGGKLPVGLAEDLADAAAFLDLDALSQCPCRDCGAAVTIPTALDRVAAGQGPQAVTADHATVEAYVAAFETLHGKSLLWQPTDDGAVFQGTHHRLPPQHPPLGRRNIPEPLLSHLKDMAAKTLVPETDASRAAGAGAGLTDND